MAPCLPGVYVVCVQPAQPSKRNTVKDKTMPHKHKIEPYANLTGANLRGADLCGAQLNDAKSDAMCNIMAWIVRLAESYPPGITRDERAALAADLMTIEQETAATDIACLPCNDENEGNGKQ